MLWVVFFLVPAWLAFPWCGVSAAAQTSPEGTPPLRIALLGQSIIRYDLRRESPESAKQMAKLLSDYDVVFTNFEAVIDDGTARPTHTGLVHRALPEAMESLKALGINMIGLSSNHSWDLGRPGVLSTIAHARRAGFAFAGTGANITEASSAGYLSTPAGTVALVALASGSLVKVGPDGVANPARATEDKAGVLELRLDHETHQVNEEDRQRILGAVREASHRARYVVVYHHNHYDEPNPEETGAWKRQWARDCVDAGAAIYVSHGTTWIRGIEIYRGKPILHGLVNFIFQVRRPVHYATFDNGAPHPDAWTSALASLTLLEDRLVSFSLTPLVLHEGREGGIFYPHGAPRVASGAVAASILQRFADRSRPLGTEIHITGGTAEVKLRPH